MPVSPTPDDSYFWEIAQSYQQAELEILGQIRDRLARGVNLDDQAWATSRLAEVQTMRREATKVLAGVNRSMASKISGSLGNAYKDGSVAALKDTERFMPQRPSAVSSEARRRAVEAIARENTGRISEVMPGILRSAEDGYREVVTSAVQRVAAGGTDRRRATSQALQQAFGKGLKTGPGSRMNLPDYVTMAVRTGTAKALIAGHLDTLGANGMELVYIHPGPRHCERCDGWANRPLHRVSGPAGTVTAENVATGNPVQVKVYGSLNEARDAGWGHPNCRCSVGAYLPGASSLPTPRPKFDKTGYEAQQRQRGIERQIREWKTREKLSLDPREQADARAKVAAWQKVQRAHLDAHPALKRQYQREQPPSLTETTETRTPPRTPPRPPRAQETPPRVEETPPKVQVPERDPYFESESLDMVTGKQSEAGKMAANRANALRAKGLAEEAIWKDDEYDAWNKRRMAYRDRMNELAAIERAAKVAAAKARKAAKAAQATADTVFDPADPLKVYGKTLHDESNDAITARWKDDMFESMSQTQHEVLAAYFKAKPGAGIFLGGKGTAVPDLDSMQHLKNVQPRGYAAGQTWSDSGGAYSPTDRRVIVGDPKLSGSASTVLHESSHALDRAYAEILKPKRLTGQGWANEITNSGEFRTLAARWQDSTRNGGQEIGFSPYYSSTGNPTGWMSEIWAEGGARLMHARSMDMDPVRAVADGLGMNRMSANGMVRYTADNDPGIRKAAQEFIDYWDKIEAEVKKKRGQTRGR